MEEDARIWLLRTKLKLEQAALELFSPNGISVTLEDFLLQAHLAYSSVRRRLHFMTDLKGAMPNRLDCFMAGLEILRPIAKDICFYNSSGGTMFIETSAPIDDEDKHALEGLGWEVPDANSAGFGEGLL